MSVVRKHFWHARQPRGRRLLLAPEVRPRADASRPSSAAPTGRGPRARATPTAGAGGRGPRSRAGTSRGSRRSSSQAAIVAHPTIASPAQEHGGLPGAAPSTGSSSSISVALEAAAQRGRVVAQPHRVELAPCRRTPRTRDRARRQLRARPDRDGVRARRRWPSTYSGSAAAIAEPPALADREAVMPAWRPSTRPAAVDDVAGPLAACRRGGRGTRARPVPARKHRSCDSGLRRPRARPRAASARTCGLACARRAGSAAARARRAAERGEHVGLVLRGVDGQRAAARRRCAARSGRSSSVAAPSRSANSSIASRRTWPLQRTHGFGVSPAACSAQPRLDDPGPELVAQVQREVREAELVGERARAAHRGGRAARALAVVVGVRPQLERHRRRPRRRRAPSSAATALSTPPHIATSVRPGPARSAPRARTAAPSARCSASETRSAACSLPALRPPSAAAICGEPIRAASSSAGALDELDRGAAGGEHRRRNPRPRSRPRRRARRRWRARSARGRRRRRRRRRRATPPGPPRGRGRADAVR